MTPNRPLRMALFGLTLLIAPGLATAETCLSPYVKRLDRQEKYLYLFCVDADEQDNDFVAVIDVDPDSDTFGTITYRLDLGSKGNETHHWGYTDDRTRIWAGGLLSSRIWILDVATDPARPRIEKVLDDVPKVAGLTGPAHLLRPARPDAAQLPRRGRRRAARRAGRVHQRRQVHPPDRPARRTPRTATTWPSSPN